MMITNLWGVGFLLFCWTGFMFVGGIMIGIEKQKEHMKGGEK